MPLRESAMCRTLGIELTRSPGEVPHPRAAHDCRMSATVCVASRGGTYSCAVQASLARAEMAAQEAGQLGRLRADIEASLQKKAQRLHTATTHLASLLGHRIEHSMHK